MTNHESPHHVDELLAKAVDGELTSDEQEALHVLVVNDPAFRQRFSRLLMVDELLSDELGRSDQSADAIVGENDLLEAADSVGLSQTLAHLIRDVDDPSPEVAANALEKLHDIAEADRKNGKRIQIWLRNRRKRVLGQRHGELLPWYFQPSVRYAAAALLLLTASLLIVFWPRSDRTNPTPVDPSIVHVVPDDAVLVRTRSAEWGEGQQPRVGAALTEGELHLFKGLALVRFGSGVEVVVEGPARFSISSDNEMRLPLGSMVARVPMNARGFAVRSPRMDVADLGTEFGFKVDEKGHADVHVFKGEVEASVLDDHGTVVKKQIIRRHESGRTSAAKPALEASTFGAIPFVHSLEHPELNITNAYVKAVQDDKPVVYLRFDDYDGFSIRDEMNSDRLVRSVGKLTMGGTASNRFAYFREGSPGLYVKSVEPLGMSPEAYTIEMWIRPDHIHWGSLFSLTGKRDGTIAAYLELGSARTTLVASRSRIRFLHRGKPGATGGTNVCSPSPYTPGQWHHLVAVKSKTLMTLYLDGKVVATGSDKTTLATPAYMVLGQLSEDNNARRYRGAIDEVAVYARALTKEEIEHHHRLVVSE